MLLLLRRRRSTSARPSRPNVESVAPTSVRRHLFTGTHLEWAQVVHCANEPHVATQQGAHVSNGRAKFGRAGRGASCACCCCCCHRIAAASAGRQRSLEPCARPQTLRRNHLVIIFQQIRAQSHLFQGFIWAQNLSKRRNRNKEADDEQRPRGHTNCGSAASAACDHGARSTARRLSRARARQRPKQILVQSFCVFSFFFFFLFSSFRCSRLAQVVIEQRASGWVNSNTRAANLEAILRAPTRRPTRLRARSPGRRNPLAAAHATAPCGPTTLMSGAPDSSQVKLAKELELSSDERRAATCIAPASASWLARRLGGGPKKETSAQFVPTHWPPVCSPNGQ